MVCFCYLQDSVCFNGASCIAYCDELDAVTNSPVYTCSCLEGFEGRNCSVQVTPPPPPHKRKKKTSKNLTEIPQPVLDNNLIIILEKYHRVIVQEQLR